MLDLNWHVGRKMLYFPVVEKYFPKKIVESVELWNKLFKSTV